MPTYEYVCLKCDHPFEVVQSMNDAPLKTCPKELCGIKKGGRGNVKRAIGAGAGFFLKGSVFYTPNYRSETKKAAAKSDPPPAAGESKSSSDTKSTPAK